jgi:hypothetical protein
MMLRSFSHRNGASNGEYEGRVGEQRKAHSGDDAIPVDVEVPAVPYTLVEGLCGEGWEELAEGHGDDEPVEGAAEVFGRRRWPASAIVPGSPSSRPGWIRTCQSSI